jgi:hypothetical protein
MKKFKVVIMTVYEFLEQCKQTALLEKNFQDVEFLKMAIENLTIEQANIIIKG